MRVLVLVRQDILGVELYVEKHTGVCNEIRDNYPACPAGTT